MNSFESGSQSGPDKTTADAVVRRAADDFPNNPQKQIDEILTYWQTRADELHKEALRTALPEGIDDNTPEADTFKNGEYTRLLAEDILVTTLGNRINELAQEITSQEKADQAAREAEQSRQKLTALLTSLDETRQLFEQSGVDTDKIDAEIANVREQLSGLN